MDKPVEVITADKFNVQELVDIYNQTRVDYIVPMPMNARRLQDYINFYDVNLEASVVTEIDDHIVNGISMLGIRQDRSWITRLGVIPIRRRSGTGQVIMNQHIEESERRNIKRMQLEVIKNNTPAHRLFLKNGFEETRELLVIRRPPSEVDTTGLPIDKQTKMRPLQKDEIAHFLHSGDFSDSAWTEEPASLINTNSLQGICLEFTDGTCGKIVYQHDFFQLSHLKMSPEAHENHDLAVNLLYALHQQQPTADVKVENVPTLDPIWQAYQALGYVVSFRRIEMYRQV